MSLLVTMAMVQFSRLIYWPLTVNVKMLQIHLCFHFGSGNGLTPNREQGSQDLNYYGTRGTWYEYSKHILRSPKYLAIFVNRFIYIDNQIINKMCLASLYLNIRLRSYQFNLQGTTDHRRLSVYWGYYTTSTHCWGKHFIVSVCDKNYTGGCYPTT